MKRFLLFLVTLVFAVAFAACKDKTNNTTQPTPTGAASTPTDAVTPTDTVTPTPTEAPTKIVVSDLVKEYAIPKIESSIGETVTHLRQTMWRKSEETKEFDAVIKETDAAFFHAPESFQGETYGCENCGCEVRDYDDELNVRKIRYLTADLQVILKTIYRTPYGICTVIGDDKVYTAHCEVLSPETGRVTLYLDNDRATFYDYDAAGRLTGERVYVVDTLVKQTVFTYDANGNVVSQQIFEPASYCYPTAIREYAFSYEKDASGRLGIWSVTYREDDMEQGYKYNLHYYKDGTVALSTANADTQGEYEAYVFIPGKELSEKLLSASNLGSPFGTEKETAPALDYYFTKCLMEYFPKIGTNSELTDECDLAEVKHTYSALYNTIPEGCTRFLCKTSMTADELNVEELSPGQLISGDIVGQIADNRLTNYSCYGNIFTFEYDNLGRLTRFEALSSYSAVITLAYYEDGDNLQIRRTHEVNGAQTPASSKPGYSKVTYTLKKHQGRISSNFSSVLAGRYDESIGDHITLEFGIQCSWLDSEKK